MSNKNMSIIGSGLELLSLASGPSLPLSPVKDALVSLAASGQVYRFNHYLECLGRILAKEHGVPEGEQLGLIEKNSNPKFRDFILETTKKVLLSSSSLGPRVLAVINAKVISSCSEPVYEDLIFLRAGAELNDMELYLAQRIFKLDRESKLVYEDRSGADWKGPAKNVKSFDLERSPPEELVEEFGENLSLALKRLKEASIIGEERYGGAGISGGFGKGVFTERTARFGEIVETAFDNKR